MKFILYSTIFIGILFSSCRAQDISEKKIPAVVLNSLKAKYPVAKNIDWEKHGTNYEAEFDVNDSAEISVQIDTGGNILMEKQDVSQSELGQAIVATIQEVYKGYVIDDAEKINKAGAVYFQAELEAKGKKKLQLVFFADGREDKSTPYWD